MVAKVVGMERAGPGGGQSTEVTINLRPGGTCGTAADFLYQGQFWWSGYGSTTKVNSCCGTAVQRDAAL